MSTNKDSKSESYRRAAESVGNAKRQLLDALRIAESSGLSYVAGIDRLCASAEVLQRKLSEKS